ncbi:MAG: DEAD/DEAH box helicase [Bacteroidia bacterium]|nr:DEAD/DEAH box helicase [Bacteroidia bacterium]
MAENLKNREEILQKLGIEKLNSMQEAALEAISSQTEIILLSPTGTGKTLAFLLPLIEQLVPGFPGVQALILAPSRELAIQIGQVVRSMGSGFKANVVYGGRPMAKDKIELNQLPALLIGTPGRIADHLRRNSFQPATVRTLVLDEFDKSLEIGFEGEMGEICLALPHVRKKILTSATHEVQIPAFAGLKSPQTLDFLADSKPQLTLKIIASPEKDKLRTLVKALCHLGNQPGIVFCNFKESIDRVSEYLDQQGIAHGCFYGGMEQKDRERSLVKFRNGTHQLILATDLAARGLDVPEIKFILHYHLPLREAEFTHRNGRTARMHSDGTAFILLGPDEVLPDFIQSQQPETEQLSPAPPPAKPAWKTLLISGGRKDKISKGDIAGLFLKQGKLAPDQLGMIELHLDFAFVAVSASKIREMIRLLDQQKLKTKKIRIREI